MRQTKRFFLMLAVFLVLAGALAYRSGRNKSELKFGEALDEVVAVVDGDELTVRDMAFYIAYEEGLIEKHAIIYDAEDTGAFWRVFTNRTFLRSKAKQTVLDMAVHDMIFYQLSRAESMELTEEEEACVADSQYDFWSDLEEEQREALGISQEEMNETIRRIALAEKYQTLLAAIERTEYDDYSFDGKAYQRLLTEHEYKVYEDIWDRIQFGSITVNH